MTTWDASFETIPADSDNISAGAGVIRTLKSAVRERMAKDHYMALDGEDGDHGEHGKVTFHQPLASNPSTGEDKGVLYTMDVDDTAELHWKDEGGNVLTLTAQGAINYTPDESLINPTGSVVAFMGASAPSGWLECSGAAVSRTTYDNLFSVISTMYGVGDGSTTFNLPDLRGYFLRGWSHGSGKDPDAGSRTDRGDGTCGDYVGTRQEDEFASHTHYDDEDLLTFDGGGPVGSNSSGMSAVLPGSVGGAETRPKNVAVMYIIKT
ncbi:Tail Collar domain protein [Desulfatibacillum aliphaticivorans]|uniref:Tail Collar domain protein n=1 Tax=Desulfatibacillum aliphaticivorans TaxID=218208 RepID=B8FJJ3_DESAL|nr:tail fiber protein [Desulfatibacillum aliphaticivorans]ACL05662.1 Tail Collar domain protein [Desulfatibacillum aliphaticivorans]